MRRGLIARSPAELPDAVLEARLVRLRGAMQAAGLDAMVVYTNITRTAGVSWLTGFVPYWSEALLVVPREGVPYLVVALSFRVKTWIERTSRIGEVLHTPRVGLNAAQQIAATKPAAAVGIADFDGLPMGIADDMREGGPNLALRDAGALFADLRGRADPAEIALAAKAAALAHHALGAAQGGSLATMVARIEEEARLHGAEEIYVAAAPDLARDVRFMRLEGEVAAARDFALRVTLSYKGTWVRLVRAFCETPVAQQAAARLAQAIADLPSERGFSAFSAWSVEGCRIAQPLEPLMGSRIGTAIPPAPGALVSVQGVVAIDGRAVPVGAPALIGDRGEAASLLVDPSFA
jgi:creatinase/prolidase-like protein